MTETNEWTVLSACFNCGKQAWFGQQGVDYEGNFCSDICVESYITKLRGGLPVTETIGVTPGALKALAARYKYQSDRMAGAIKANNGKVINMATSAMGKIEEEAANLGLALRDLLTIDTSTAVVTNNKLTPINPQVPPAKLTKAQRGAEQVAARAHQLAAERIEQGTSTVRREPRPKKSHELRPCLDGCGQMVSGKFWMGHDAKLKSLILKVERGEEPVSNIPDVVQDLVKFKRGDIEEIRDSKGTLMGKVQTMVCTAAPVKFPGRSDIQFTERE